MNCSVCGNQIHAGRAMFKCSCGSYMHAQCWEKHVVLEHSPQLVIGTVTLDGDFLPQRPEVTEEKIEEEIEEKTEEDTSPAEI